MGKPMGFHATSNDDDLEYLDEGIREAEERVMDDPDYWEGYWQDGDDVNDEGTKE